MYINLGKGRYVLDINADRSARAAMEAYLDLHTKKNGQADILYSALGLNPDSLLCAETGMRMFELAHKIARNMTDYDSQAWDIVTRQLRTTLGNEAL
ncbi:hypothetical protein RGU70_06585 [Herbaspirillum sp. RTI4]|uniref:hypothetical protein n=1 Tax=Herbaspirillum sp. RTI4 TaxID=3048640 RepID=UPI002AB37688|nr:hypothetical protein [Herbaspirillum sp. RTI4]MDY7577981.1 hypothetical protein [Herbaspirillum sp. RTI4]MEA9982089.1 hypothetical protein [Herbaspirillum sp. RTI4]